MEANRVMGWQKVGRPLSRIVSPGFGFLLFAVTYIPILLVILFSFNSSQVATFPIERLTLKWYRLLLQNESILQAFGNTLLLGVTAVAGSLLIGVLSAYFLHRYHVRGAFVYQLVILMPFILPGIFTGLALLLFFSAAGIPRSLFTVFIGHIVFCTAVVFKTVMARFGTLERSQEEASADLGANAFQTFLYVVLPNLRTALITGALLAFVLSFDETMITFFVIGPQLTLPLKIWAMMRANFSPQVHALASVVFITSTVLVVVFSKYILGRESRR
jgi:ABC-type spermidine/putrescine transport system permease subunit II